MGRLTFPRRPAPPESTSTPWRDAAFLPEITGLLISPLRERARCLFCSLRGVMAPNRTGSRLLPSLPGGSAAAPKPFPSCSWGAADASEHSALSKLPALSSLQTLNPLTRMEDRLLGFSVMADVPVARQHSASIHSISSRNQENRQTPRGGRHQGTN